MMNGLFFQKKNFITDICKIEDMSFKREHNFMNSMTVCNIAMIFGIQPESIKNAFQSFKGVDIG